MNYPSAYINNIVRFSILCRIFGHKKKYTEEYRNQNKHVQSDRVCVRCGESEVAWTGPTVDEIEEAWGETVPSKEKAYSEIGVCQIESEMQQEESDDE